MPSSDTSLPTSLSLGVDLGGTKIEIVALDASGNERLRRRVPTPQGDYRGTVAAVAALVGGGRTRTSGQRGSVGLGIPVRNRATAG
ncbi:MAG: ROK family protein [Propionivibrio sp.]|uniref:ROK family protein n=1 Tax=Propionivibrio sp. TaxID=2212460 RepID=UPI0025E27E5C|nr:ROK family protein [Propionivibrio sp.]MBL0208665.1 ROK family protein [Propionivibrio sp.]